MRIHIKIETTGVGAFLVLGKDKLGWTIQDLTEEARVVARRPQIESLHLMMTGGNVSAKRKALVSRALQLPTRLHPPDRAHAVLVDGDEIVASDASRLAPLPPQSPASAGVSRTAMSPPACSSELDALKIGDVVDVYSSRANAWFEDGGVVDYAAESMETEGENGIIKIRANAIKVIYNGGQYCKWVPPASFHKHLRPASLERFAATRAWAVQRRLAPPPVAARAVPLASPAPAQSWQVPAGEVVAGHASQAWLKSEASTRGVILTPSPRAPARSRFPPLPPIPVAADTKSNQEAAPSPWLDALIATRAKLLERSVEKDQQIAELEKQVADLRLKANKLTVELPLDADWAVDNYGRKIIPVQYPGSKGKDA